MSLLDSLLSCVAEIYTPNEGGLKPRTSVVPFQPWTIELLSVGDRVLVRDMQGETWEAGSVAVIDSYLGPRVLVDGYENPYFYAWIRPELPLAGYIFDDDGCNVEEHSKAHSKALHEADHTRKDDTPIENLDSATALAVKRLQASPEALLYKELFQPYSDDAGRQASAVNRATDLASQDGTLTYGEILFSTFVVTVLERIKEHGGLLNAKVFTDIGCGTAKPVFAAALTHPFEVSRGVELLGDLAHLAEEIAERYRIEIQPKLPSGDGRRATKIEIIEGDAFAVECSWEDSDVVFANSTCFTDELFALFREKCRLLKPGSFVACTTTRMW